MIQIKELDWDGLISSMVCYRDIYELALWSPDDTAADAAADMAADTEEPGVSSSSGVSTLTDEQRLLIHIKQQQDNMQLDLSDIEAKVTGMQHTTI